MVLLTTSVLTYRTFVRSEQAIVQRDQQVIFNSATPAVDRAKAKLDFLFRNDDRFPSGLPSSDWMADLMLKKDDRLTGLVVEELGVDDAYTLDGETRIDINGDGKLDNAWYFTTDLNGDGNVANNEIVAYSILVDDENGAVDLTSPQNDAKAEALVTRTGPVATTEATPACEGAEAEAGWQVVDAANGSSLQNNFQVDVFVADTNAATNTFETLEFQQSRIASRANKWGAWWRYDLELFPGSAYNWNGAMHTDGSLGVDNNVKLMMVSSHNSCVYSQESSEITLGETDNFQGQVIRGNLNDDKYKGQNKNIQVHVWADSDNKRPNYVNMNGANDSVDPIEQLGGSKRPSAVAMNPLKLFTEDVTEHTVAPSDTTWKYDEATYEATPFFTQKRIFNDEVSKPFVDDFYRADDRWGPKPRYDNKTPALDIANVAAKVGEPIDASDDSYARVLDPEVGLDGYWERRAIASGLRIIVGERLELGNPQGWGYDPTELNKDGSTAAVLAKTPAKNSADDDDDDDDNIAVSVEPMYPPLADYTVGAKTGSHEYLQRRSLRDNLAAVQGMVVYHYQVDGGEFPAACMAATSHPGSPETILNSRDFGSWIVPATADSIKADFLTGKGTNGWEFHFPTALTTDFSAEVVATKPLGKALRNLAYFAGDPNGGAPSFPAAQDTFVHPYPYQSMWGDFSVLRRIIDGGGLTADSDFDALSYADKATVHSAACTLSLLAYNLDSINTQHTETQANGVNAKTYATLAASLSDVLGAGTVPGSNPGNVQNQILGGDRISLPEWSAGLADDDLFSLLDSGWHYRAVERDRTLGFKDSGLSAAATPVNYDPATATYTVPAGGFLADRGATPNGTADTNELFYEAGQTYRTYCDPADLKTAYTITSDADALSLAIAMCPGPHYPSLYYLFPKVDHALAGADDTSSGGVDHTQPAAEEYISELTTYGEAVNVTVTDPSGLAAVPSGAATPATTWTVPASNATAPSAALTTANLDNPDQAFVVNGPAGAIEVPFLEKAAGNGREQMSIRLLDLAVDVLTKQKVKSTDVDTGLTADYWLSADKDEGAEGVVFAFREDAVREDEIVRPKGGKDVATCSAVDKSKYPQYYAIERDTDCMMNALPGSEQDPPLSAKGISLKPVDFVADPMRRAYGFRWRTTDGSPADFSGGTPATGRQVGMTFVTDNAAYILGNFNPHTKDGTVATDSILEEFKTPEQGLLNGNIGYGNAFYDNRTDLDSALATPGGFAKLDKDHWRTVEILADSVNILSNNFKDGSIQDYYIKAQAGSNGGATSSYMNMNRPRYGSGTTVDLANFVHEDPDDTTSPMWIDRNGTFFTFEGVVGANGAPKPFHDAFSGNTWLAFSDKATRNKHQMKPPAKTYVNALFVSGVVPSRPQQYNGGLHNYPRFIEYWKGQNLYIQGSFLQLNFSTAATAPFDQKEWEPGTKPDSDQFYQAYLEPNRLWGYDVAFLLQPPAPAARRFVSIGSPRSEYYRELPADDPYIKTLRCAETADGTKVFSGSATSVCP